jgi:ribosomal-protein-alanine N-acetyltransferase
VTERTIRDMTSADIASVLEIERACFITPWTEGMFRSQLLFTDQAITLVLLEEGILVGYAAAWMAYDEIHLLSIAVAPAARRRGLGGEILGAVLERGRARRAERAILEVREGNAAARAFYRVHRFVDIGLRRRYYSDTDEDAIVMEYVFDD